MQKVGRTGGGSAEGATLQKVNIIFMPDLLHFLAGGAILRSETDRREEKPMVWTTMDTAADLDDLIFDEDRAVPSER